MLNNAGKSAGSQIVLDRSCITPATGTGNDWTLTPDKIWFKNADARPWATCARPSRSSHPQRHAPDDGDHQLRDAAGGGIDLHPADHTGPDREPRPPTPWAPPRSRTATPTSLLRTIGYTFDDYVTEKEVRAITNGCCWTRMCRTRRRRSSRLMRMALPPGRARHPGPDTPRWARRSSIRLRHRPQEMGQAVPEDQAPGPG
jgi:hypothetical protein